ncbi:hypothetical protein MKX01_006624 [Papaver californicum]|nr:hypothetical protein MKX01_006624 [Papaver californicum]
MEGKNVKMISLVVIVVMLRMLVEKSSAFEKPCYVTCYEDCFSRHGFLGVFVCPFTCLKKNISRNYYCELGCAVSNCINISTRQDARGDEMEDCVNFHCGNICKN